MWTDKTVLYHIYPLGFCGAPAFNDGIVINRIKKVKDFIPHLKNMGVGGIYFSPVFQSDKHGYDTRDFFNLDCRLGTNEDFAEVTSALHKENIKVILDGVFNHVGRGFDKFEDVLINRHNSVYKDWFFIDFNGNTPYNDGFYYKPWEGHFELVTLNLNHWAVKEHIFNAIKFWIEKFDIDGLRLDVAYLLDKNFLRELRGFVKSIKPDFVLIGEVLFGDYNLIVNPDMLDSCTNYENYKSLYSAFNSNNLFEISYSLNRQFGRDPWCIYRGKHLLTFLDNHDVSRIATVLNNKNLIYNAYVMLMTMPGIPTVYYGSEWGIEGDKKDGDESLRPNLELREENPLSTFIAKLISLRIKSDVLCFGDYKNVSEKNTSLVFLREFNGSKVIVGINIAKEKEMIFNNEFFGEFYDLINETDVSLDGKIEINGENFVVLSKK